MKKHLFILVALLVGISIVSAADKKIWAKSVLNQKAPDLVVEKWLTEKPETAGKFVMIDFWATWCGPCVTAIPELNRFQKEFKDDLVVIGISSEDEQTVRDFKKVKIEYSSALDPKSRMNNELEVSGIPHVILIDPEGIVRWEGYPLLNGHELTSDVVAEVIRKYKK